MLQLHILFYFKLMQYTNCYVSLSYTIVSQKCYEIAVNVPGGGLHLSQHLPSGLKRQQSLHTLSLAPSIIPVCLQKIH